MRCRDGARSVDICEFHKKFKFFLKLVKIDFVALTEDQLRQFIDAEAAFQALEVARQQAAEVRGSMFWRAVKGQDYLIRATTGAKQQSLGARSSETEELQRQFAQRKSGTKNRVKQLAAAVARHQRLNRALRVGRAPNVLAKILDALQSHGVSEHFMVVGTHALYAYEAAAGVRITPEALATQDVDLLFDTRRRLAFFSRLALDDVSLLQVLRKADRSFALRNDQKQTAVNDKGFEVDIIRRAARDGDPHPLRMSHHADDLWAVQVHSGDAMLGAARFSQIVVATDGSMARLTTMAPRSFVKLKQQLSKSASRDPRKRSKDAQQASIVQVLLKGGGLRASPG